MIVRGKGSLAELARGGEWGVGGVWWHTARTIFSGNYGDIIDLNLSATELIFLSLALGFCFITPACFLPRTAGAAAKHTVIYGSVRLWTASTPVCHRVWPALSHCLSRRTDQSQTVYSSGSSWFKQSLFTLIWLLKKQSHWISIIQAKLIANAHKHN